MSDLNGKNKYGWKPQKPDFRDKVLKLDRKTAAVLPPTIDLRGSGFMPAVYDQGDLGSCTANAAAAALAFDLAKQKKPIVVPSRLFIYWEERVIEGTVKQDSGAELRDAAKVLNKQGACTETLMPYKISQFTKAPTAAAISDAATRKIKVYQAVDNTDITALKTALAAGFPVMFGFSVYESFESDAVAKNGKVPMPKKTEKLLGGHAVLAVGYTKTAIIVRNSWGDGWGDGGYCYMPFAYITNPSLCSDFWQMESL